MQGPRPRTCHPSDTAQIEKQFAVKAVMYMQTHWNLLESRRGSELRLTNIDEEIYLDFRDKFPDFDPAQPLDEDSMKGRDKEKWRKFIAPYENRVKDFNFGTMLRRDPKTEYGEAETIFGMPIAYHRPSANLLSRADAVRCH
jgi:hypothetical protein